MARAPPFSLAVSMFRRKACTENERTLVVPLCCDANARFFDQALELQHKLLFSLVFHL
jgi:hypothetical protein